VPGPYFPNVERLFVQTGATLEQVMRLIDELASGVALVVDDDGRLLATLTDGDIRRALLVHVGIDQPVSNILAQKNAPITAAANLGRSALLAMLNDRQVQQLPILDASGRVVDLALLKDLQKDDTPSIQALIMAGGFGTRLMPLTQNIPKPMLPVAGRPLLELTVERLTAAGIRNINVSTHYLSKKISDHFGDGSRFGVNIRYFQEDKPLGTGGALRLLDEITQTTLVINGDIVTDLDYRVMAEFHHAHSAAATIAVANYDVRIPYGVIHHDGVNVTGLVEKPVITQFINAGIYLVEPRVLKYLEQDRIFHMTDLLEKLIAHGERVVVFPVQEYWIDVGQHADYEQVQKDIGAGLIKKMRPQTP
jgi:dTDP-glucose pyrophosphorylase